MSLPKRSSNPIHYNGIDLRWSVSVRCGSDQGEGLLTVQSEIGQRLFVKLALNDYWLHGPGRRYSITPALVRNILAQAVSLGWSPGTNGRDFQTSLDEFDQLQQIL